MCQGGCKRNATVFGDAYPTCPERWRLDPRWLSAVQLYNASKANPLAGWPDDYLPWIVEAVTAIESANSERMEAELEKRQRKSAAARR